MIVPEPTSRASRARRRRDSQPPSRPAVLGEAWLFLSLRLLAYAGAMAVFFQVFVTGYEERMLARRFGRSYLEYRSTVPRWIPRPPPTSKIS